MKRFILCLMAITSGMTVTNEALAQDRSNSRQETEKPRMETSAVANQHNGEKALQVEQTCKDCRKAVRIDTVKVADLPQELLTLNGLKYMLSQGASVSDIQRGIYIVNGKKVQVKS